MSDTVFDSKYDCCGCSACYAVCPTNAIHMDADEEGFRYPQIDPALCVHCHRCREVCPLRAGNGHPEPIKIYAAKNCDEAVRKHSSSGGIFFLLADYVQRNGGVVYGAAFDECYRVRHVRAESAGEWKKFCVSKYVQSDMADVFSAVCEDLCDGRTVLFSGTPCQIDGLKRYLKGVKAGHLITCDIVCHGVPSPQVWEDYLLYLSQSSGKTISSVSFRDKERLGWHDSTLTIKDEDGYTLLSDAHKDNCFSQLCFCHEILRPACHRCQYASFRRPGDMTLGDFWGIEKNFAPFDDNKGVSLVMVNTETGERIWHQICDNADFFEVSKDQCIQPNLIKPSEENPGRTAFWQWYHRYGFKRAGQWRGLLPAAKGDRAVLLLLRCEYKLRRWIGRK